MRSQGELKDLQRRHVVQLKHAKDSGSHDINQGIKMQQDLKRELAKWEIEKQKIANDIERSFKRGDHPNQDKLGKLQDAIMRSPDMLRITDRIQKVTMQLGDIQRNISRHKQTDLSTEKRLERSQQAELDKLTNEQQNKVKALQDAWLRESQALKSHIQLYDNIRTRTETRYKDLSRQHIIEMKRQADIDSRKRAQTGDNKGRKNYAKAEGENVLDPNNAQGIDSEHSHRSGVPRW